MITILFRQSHLGNQPPANISQNYELRFLPNHLQTKFVGEWKLHGKQTQGAPMTVEQSSFDYLVSKRFFETSISYGAHTWAQLQQQIKRNHWIWVEVEVLCATAAQIVTHRGKTKTPWGDSVVSKSDFHQISGGDQEQKQKFVDPKEVNKTKKHRETMVCSVVL